jgi:hypothetical protein
MLHLPVFPVNRRFRSDVLQSQQDTQCILIKSTQYGRNNPQITSRSDMMYVQCVLCHVLMYAQRVQLIHTQCTSQYIQLPGNFSQTRRIQKRISNMCTWSVYNLFTVNTFSFQGTAVKLNSSKRNASKSEARKCVRAERPGT